MCIYNHCQACESESPHLVVNQHVQALGHAQLLLHGLAAPKGGDDQQPPPCKRTKNIRAIQLLLGHTKLESTVRYLGIEVDDALEMAEMTEA